MTDLTTLSTRDVIMRGKEVYSSLIDEESKLIFQNKMLYALSNSQEEKNICLHKIWRYKDPARYEELKKACMSGKELVVYGVGDYCVSTIDACRWLGGEVDFLCDSNMNRQGEKGPYGLEILSPDQLLEEHADACVVISTLRAHKEVADFLRQYMQSEQVIEFAVDIEKEFPHEQYFDKDIMNYEDEEVFVDCGCYDFSTSQYLDRLCNVKKVFAFEPDLANISKIENNIEKSSIHEVELINKGVWNKSQTLLFCSTGSSTSYFTENENEATERLDVVSLDETIKEKVTFIKMDIEGSELKALEGAKNLIQNCKPKLAICVYHKVEDIIDIPTYIKSIVPEYRLYLRHYSNFDHETVLYAIV